MERSEGDPPFVVVGHLSKPHGTKGEVYVWSLTDRPETTFVVGAELHVAGPGGDLPDDGLPALRVTGVRPYRKGFLVHFDGILDRDQAEILGGRYLLRPFRETDPLEEEEIFYHQLLGMTVVTLGGEEVGRIHEVYGLRPAELLDVRGEARDHLIPFTREIVVEWSTADRRLIIDPPEGLLDL
jgi:16S rRNA processing protein RimM